MNSSNIKNNIPKTSNVTSIGNLKCSTTCEKTPSTHACMPCCMKLKTEHDNVLRDDSLSYRDKINFMFSELSDIQSLHSLTVPLKDVILVDLHALYMEMASKIEELTKENDVKSVPVDIILEVEKLRIPIDGYQYTNWQKAGYFLFDENNENGLRFPKKHIEQTAIYIAAYFLDPDGKALSYRTVFDNLNTGSNLKRGHIFTS